MSGNIFRINTVLLRESITGKIILNATRLIAESYSNSCLNKFAVLSKERLKEAVANSVCAQRFSASSAKAYLFISQDARLSTSLKLITKIAHSVNFLSSPGMAGGMAATSALTLTALAFFFHFKYRDLLLCLCGLIFFIAVIAISQRIKWREAAKASLFARIIGFVLKF